MRAPATGRPSAHEAPFGTANLPPPWQLEHEVSPRIGAAQPRQRHGQAVQFCRQPGAPLGLGVAGLPGSIGNLRHAMRRDRGDQARDSLIAASTRSPIPVATRKPARMCGSVVPVPVDRVMAETRRPEARATVPSVRMVEARLEAGVTGRTVPEIRGLRCRDMYGSVRRDDREERVMSIGFRVRFRARATRSTATLRDEGLRSVTFGVRGWRMVIVGTLQVLACPRDMVVLDE